MVSFFLLILPRFFIVIDLNIDLNAFRHEEFYIFIVLLAFQVDLQYLFS